MERLHKRPWTSSRSTPSPSIHLSLTLLISTFLLLSVPATAISLSDFQQIHGFDSACTKAYTAAINGCVVSDFNPPTAPCSPGCAAALQSESVVLNALCRGVSADPTTLIGLFFQGRGVSALCPSIASVGAPSAALTSTQPDSTASIVGTASFSSSQQQTLSTQTTPTTTQQTAATTRMMTMMTTAGIQATGTSDPNTGGNTAPPIASPMSTTSGGPSAAVAGGGPVAAATSGAAVFGGGAVPFSASNSAPSTTASAQTALAGLGLGLLFAGTWVVMWL